MLDDKTTIMLKQEMLLQITNNLYQKTSFQKMHTKKHSR